MKKFGEDRRSASGRPSVSGSGRPSISAPLRVQPGNGVAASSQKGRKSSTSSIKGKSRSLGGPRNSSIGNFGFGASAFVPKNNGRPSSGIGVRGRTDVPSDPRPIKDKKYINQCIRQLLDFLMHKNYPHPISQKLLVSPSSKDFFKIFAFMFGQLKPGYKMAAKMEEEVPRVLRMLGYPFSISKQYLYSVGSPHTWPHLLAAIMWMMEIVQSTLRVHSEGGIDAIIFGPRSAEDFDKKSDDHICFNYIERTYEEFLNGKDVFQELDEELASTLRQAYQGEDTESVEKDIERLENELDRVAQEEALRFRGCSTDKQFQKVLDEIAEEIERRKAIHQLTADRTKIIKESYQQLHPNIWQLEQSYFDKRFLDIVKEAKSRSRKDVLNTILYKDGSISESFDVYQFPLLTKKFVTLLMEEIEHFKASPLPKTRPNTMNKYGLSLEEMGLSQTLITPLIQSYLIPLSATLFPSWGGASIDSFKAFLVNYEIGHDISLAEHYDNAEVTLNISLTENHNEGDISFGPLHGEVVEEVEDFSDEENFDLVINRRINMQHKLGHALLHCGRQMHQALPITEGSRTNLIIWMRSSSVRNHCCPMCGEPPTLIPVPASGEGFTLVDVCSCS